MAKRSNNKGRPRGRPSPKRKTRGAPKPATADRARKRSAPEAKPAPKAARKKIIGSFIGHERGFGFVTPDGGGDDIFIPPSQRGEAMHGDRVEVITGLPDRRGRLAGEITKIIERGTIPVVGLFDGKLVVPRDPRFDTWVRVHQADKAGAEPGDLVVVEVTRRPFRHRQAAGKIVEILGQDGDPGIESRVVLKTHQFEEEFPPDVMDQALRAPSEVQPEDIAGRKDLRDLFTVTIDPERARDFDDALSIAVIPGGWRVWVSIADVSHYVTSGSPLDREAFARATSVYLPDRSVPMLPHELSSGICSLKPGVDRLAMTAEMDFGHDGRRLAERFYASVIRSNHRLVYEQVEQMEHDRSLREKFPGAWEAAAQMHELMVKRRALRIARGMIDLDMPEAEVVLGPDGEVSTVLRREQTWSHKLVEEFMLSANEAVAEFMTDENQPMVYRIHEPPSAAAVETLAGYLAPFGMSFFGRETEPENVKPRDYQRVIDKSKGGPFEDVVKMLCLRSMMQARYSAELAGHFGLASDRYCHFTSPIRRYPDLIVHRLLKAVLDPSTHHGRAAPANLPTAAAHSSERERAAEEVERELVKLYCARWMSRHLGEEFTGTVNGAASFGLFITLEEIFIEGMVPLESIGPDAWFSETDLTIRVGRVRYRIGDKVNVQAQAVDLVKRRIYFWLLEKIGKED